MRANAILLGGVVLVGALAQVHVAKAQDDPTAATDPSNPWLQLANRLNDPNDTAAQALRATWNIDRVVWHEPSFFTDAAGNKRLYRPAHAEIHAYFLSDGETFATWTQAADHAVMANADKAPAAVKCLIPRGYGQDPSKTNRLIVTNPQGVANECLYDTVLQGNQPIEIEAGCLRSGMLVVGHNSYFPNAKKQNSSLEMSKLVNKATRYTIDMLSGTSGLGVNAPRYVYAFGSSRGSNILNKSIELDDCPFDGVMLERGGHGVVHRPKNVVKFLGQMIPVNATQAQIQPYFDAVGRTMVITKANGTQALTLISPSLNADLIANFHLPTNTSILYNQVPPFADFGIVFRSNNTTTDVDTNGTVGNPNGSDGTPVCRPGSVRSVLLDIDPAYLASVDAGTALLRDWDPAHDPSVLQQYNDTDTTGAINPRCKVYMVNGGRDPQMTPQYVIDYLNQIIAQGRINQVRNYFVKGLPHQPATVETKVADANGVLHTLGRYTGHIDQLVAWVENGTEPGDFLSVVPSAQTQTQVNKGAFANGYQYDPKSYLAWVEGIAIPDVTKPQVTVSASTASGAYTSGVWTASDVTLAVSATDNTGGSGVAKITVTINGVSTDVAGAAATVTISTEGNNTVSVTATDNAGNVSTAVALVASVDKSGPTVTANGNAGTYTVDQTVNITWSATDSLSGVASVDATPVTGDAYSFGLGAHTFTASATDNVGNVGNGSTTFTVVVTFDSLSNLVTRFVTKDGVAKSLNAKLREAARGDDAGEKLRAFQHEVAAQSGKSMTAGQAATLTALAQALMPAGGCGDDHDGGHDR